MGDSLFWILTRWFMFLMVVFLVSSTIKPIETNTPKKNTSITALPLLVHFLLNQAASISQKTISMREHSSAQ